MYCAAYSVFYTHRMCIHKDLEFGHSVISLPKSVGCVFKVFQNLFCMVCVFWFFHMQNDISKSPKGKGADHDLIWTVWFATCVSFTQMQGQSVYRLFWTLAWLKGCSVTVSVWGCFIVWESRHVIIELAWMLNCFFRCSQDLNLEE